MPSTRRTVLVAVAAGIAGCTAMPGRPDDGSPSDERPAATDTDEPRHDDCTAGVDVSLAPFAPTDDLPMQVGEHRDVVAAAIADGTAVETYGQEPLREGIVAHDGAYYRLSVDDAGSERVPAYLFDVTWESGRTAPDDATRLAFDDLPESDRAAVRFLVPDGDGAEDEGHPTQSFSGRDRPVPYPDGGDDSALLDHEAVWVRLEGREYRLRPGAETTIESNRYRYTADRIAESDGELRSWAAETFLVDLSLSETQRDLLDDAAADYYGECAPASDALAGIQDQLSDDHRLPQPADGWYVAVDGERHRLEMRRWVE